MKSGTASIPPEHAAILRVIRAIPRGRVTSYGEIAARAGLPRRARMVGRILGAYSALKLPWQRVLRSDGRIAFARGSRGYREQRVLLVDEGVVVAHGRVDLARYGWQRDLDAELWKMA
ncbi:MAG: MGMT family protein [Xanthomonadaceae bacterium]|nr:MGMT family protein [Xanthomonadaceae bacterium]MDE1961475.1 MGMT family protein [Xanthomonadaceae bacterium]